MISANHRIDFKVSKTSLLFHNRRPQRDVHPVLNDSPGPIKTVTFTFPAPAMPEITCQFVVTPALLLPYPPVDCLRTYHLFPLQPEPTANLLRTVLAVDDEPSHGSFPLVGELQVVSPGLHPPFVLLLGQLPSIPMVATPVAVPANLTAHRACTDSNHFPISLRLIGVCSNASIVYRCSLVKCLYPILCRFSGYGSKVILSRFKALHFRVESISIFSIINALPLQRGSLTRRKRIIHLVCVADRKGRFRAKTRGRRKPSGILICVADNQTAQCRCFSFFS